MFEQAISNKYFILRRNGRAHHIQREALPAVRPDLDGEAVWRARRAHQPCCRPRRCTRQRPRGTQRLAEQRVGHRRQRARAVALCAPQQFIAGR